jgi:hypothetical protein
MLHSAACLAHNLHAAIELLLRRAHNALDVEIDDLQLRTG